MNYFVSKNGHDDNSGCEWKPFATIAKGISVLEPRDILYVKAGTYSETLEEFSSGSSWGMPITMKAYPGDIVILQPSSIRNVLRFEDCSYVIVSGFILDGLNVTENAVRVEDAHHIRVQNSEVKNSPKSGICTVNQDSDYNEFINLNIHDAGTGQDHGLYITTSYNLIEHCLIHANAQYGVHVYSESTEASYNIVRYNKIYDNARLGGVGTGIILSCGDGNVAYNNLVWGNYRGIQIANGDNQKVFYNTVYNNDDYGIYLSNSSNDAIVRNNISYQNADNFYDNGVDTVADHNLETDPDFVNEATFDLRLKDTSDAIDAGLEIEGIYDDYARNPRDSSPDIGAYEYVE